MGPYGLTMSDALARARFAHFVQRVIDSARARGLTDPALHAATGVMPSTYYRWMRGELRTTPDLGKVRAFCLGAGADIGEAMTALGLTGERDTTEPQPALEPDMRRILRRLNDPDTPAQEKWFIRETLRMLAARNVRSRAARGDR